MRRMSDLDYSLLVREALLEVPRKALRQVAREGLPGEHHFYLSFRTDHPGVSVSPGLLARHPREMTIVIQHQYWDLAVGDEAFSVTLRFGGTPERLHVPFVALTAFADPTAEFGLRFDGNGEPGAAKAEEKGVSPGEGRTTRPAPEARSEPGGPRARNVVDIRSFRRSEENEPAG
jgi:uncharacterized protein